MKLMLVASLLLTLAPNLAPAQARDTPPPAFENARRERELRAAVAAGTATKEIYQELAVLMNRQNRFDEMIEALRGAAALEPTLAEPHHRIATLFWDKSRVDVTLDVTQRRSYIDQGLAEEDRALALQPDHMEAMTYKNILLRLKANAISDPIEQKRLIDEADALRTKVIAMQKDRQVQTPPGAPESPDAPFPGFSEPFDQALARLQPLRVGGGLRVPIKVKDFKPVYPAVAQSARVQGVVIIEAIVDDSGRVVSARVLRSIPLLDAAALEAVSKWQFAPAEAGGRHVPVLMTVTVNFTLME